MKRAHQLQDEKNEAPEARQDGLSWREVTAEEWFSDGKSQFESGSSEEEPYDSAEDEVEEYGTDEEEEEEQPDDDDELNPETQQKLISWLGRHDPPEPEESEDETHNTVGNVPMEWYADYPHIGYDLEGKKIMKRQGPAKDEMDRFLDRTDDPNYWHVSSRFTPFPAQT